MALREDVKQTIDQLVQGNRVVLFMKGNKNFPQCGFSATVVNILKELDVPFETANVLTDPELREGIKSYSDWPTIPQLYVNGEFLGGCDIVREMYQSGELHQALGVEQQEVAPPKVTITEAAAKAFRDAAEPDAGDEVLRIEIDPRFSVDLYFGPKQPGDLEVTSAGIRLAVGRGSAKRAEGITIDFVDGPDGAGFRIDNPNAPKTVSQMSPKQLKALLDRKEPLYLFDVRTEKERATAKIEASVLFDEKARADLAKLPKDALIVFTCHHGGRSLRAAQAAVDEGFGNVHNLAGGIDAWSQEIDPSIPRY